MNKQILFGLIATAGLAASAVGQSEFVRLEPPSGTPTTEQFGADVAISKAAGLVAVADLDAGNDLNGRVFLYDLQGNIIRTIEPIDVGFQLGSIEFGTDLAFNASGTVLAVGAPRYRFDDGGMRPVVGAVYLYDTSSSSGETVVSGPQGAQGPQNSVTNARAFGTSVDLSGNIMLVGAPGSENTGDVGQGAVFAYTDVNLLTNGVSDIGDDPALVRATMVEGYSGFGERVRFDGSVVAVTAESVQVGPNDDTVRGVFVFDDVQQKAVIEDPLGPRQFELFGDVIDVDGDRIFVGDRTSPNSSGTPDGGFYVYEYDGMTNVTLVSSGPEFADSALGLPASSLFGFDLAADGGRLVIGAPLSSTPFTGFAVSVDLSPLDNPTPTLPLPQSLFDSSVCGADDLGYGASVAIDANLTAIGRQENISSGSYVMLYSGTPTGGCNPADLAEPFCQLDLADIGAFVTAFQNGDLLADLNGDGILDLADITIRNETFLAGCP